MKTTEEQLKEMTENAIALYEACKEALKASHNPVVEKILTEAMAKTK